MRTGSSLGGMALMCLFSNAHCACGARVMACSVFHDQASLAWLLQWLMSPSASSLMKVCCGLFRKS